VFGLLRLEASDIDSPNLGAAAPYPRLKAGFDDAVKRAGINVVYGARVVAVHHVARHAEAHLVTGEQLRADCLVLADGAGSDLVAGFKRFERDSGQTAVIARAAPHKPRTGVAFERFTPGGALALVPRADGEWTVIWARPKHEADRLRSDESGTAAEINAAFGSAMGHLTLTSKISSYPLNWRFVEPRVSGAIAAMGNAAQGLHPAAAQGLNLGFRDVRDFVSVLVRNRERAHAVPVAAVLNEFARARSADRIMSIGFTGLLAHGFDRGGWLAGLPRGLSLTALQLATPLRRELTRRFALN
jgi:2-octaprenyl-6-methoxyphenol hydroxylase